LERLLCRSQAKSLSLSTLHQVVQVPVACVQLCLQADDGLITFVQALRQSNHDVPLLQEKLLVSTHLRLVILHSRELSRS